MRMKPCDFIGLKFTHENEFHIILLFESRKKGKLLSLDVQEINRFLTNNYLHNYLLLNSIFINFLSSKKQAEVNSDLMRAATKSKADLTQEYDKENSNG